MGKFNASASPSNPTSFKVGRLRVPKLSDKDGGEFHIPAPPDDLSPAAVSLPVPLVSGGEQKKEENGKEGSDDEARSGVLGDVYVRSPPDQEDLVRLESGGPEKGNRKATLGSTNVERLNNGHRSPISSALSAVPSSPLGGGHGYMRPGEGPGQRWNGTPLLEKTCWTTGHLEDDAVHHDCRSQPISPDATMVDGTFPPPQPPQPQPQSPSQATPATPSVARSHNHSLGPTVSSMLRNMADLLEYVQGTPPSSSNKGRSKDTGLAPYLSAFSPVVSTLLDEFETMREDMRKSQQDHREGLEAIWVSYRSEVKAPWEELRTRKEREVEAMARRHEEEIMALREAIRGKDERERGRKELADEARVPTLELHELRRRVAALESRAVEYPGEDSRQPTVSNHPTSHPLLSSPLAQFPRLATSTLASETLYPHPHPLGHLLDTAASNIAHFPSSAPAEDASASSALGAGAQVLPIKTKRKRGFGRVV